MRKYANMFTKHINRRFLHVCMACYKKVVPSHSKIKGTSSTHWLTRQLSDPYVEKAKIMNFRCRSAFKLIEIDDRYHFLKPGQIVIDCGAAPGSWTQVAVKRVNADNFNKDAPEGVVIAVDRQQIYPIIGATILGNLDFTCPATQDKLQEILGNRKVDIVLSDMAPNASGIKEMDDENILNLCYSVLRFAALVSNVNAILLCKMWQSGGTKTLQNDAERFYSKVHIVKPNSSRTDSAEIFVLARGFKGLKSR